MKKRYVVAVTAALVGGSLAIEMQAGSTGLANGMIDEAPAARGGGGSGGGVRAGAAGVPARPIISVKTPGNAGPGTTPEKAGPILVSDIDASSLPSEESSGSGSVAGLLPSNFDGVLVQPRGYDGASMPMPEARFVDIGGAGFGVPSGGGGGGNAPGGSAAPDLLGRNLPGSDIGAPVPQAVSAVPEPATWFSFIVGLGLVGYSLRHRTGSRSVSS